MIDRIHVERHYDTWITAWTSRTWTHKYEYEHEHKRFKWHDKHLRETCAWNYLGKWYMVIKWLGKNMVAQLFLALSSHKIFMFYNKLVVKMTKHEVIWGKLMVETTEVYLKYPYLCKRYDSVYFTWCMLLCDMGY